MTELKRSLSVQNKLQSDNPSQVVESTVPEDSIKLFLNLINEGKLDGAASMIEPDFMSELVGGQIDKKPVVVMLAYVRLFEKGQLEDYLVHPAGANGNTFMVELQLKNNQTVKFSIHMVRKAASKLTMSNWYLKKISMN